MKSCGETVSVARGRKSGDDALLESLGYKQEFKREFTPLELFGVVFSILGVVPSIASVLVYALPNGGPVSMIWGWAVCTVFLFMMALAMAELGSAAPTSGGLYYWTFKFSSPRWRYLLCWIVGYANTIGNIGAVASVAWGCAVQIMAAASIGSNMTFAPTTGQTYGCFCAVAFVMAIVCSSATKVIARLQTPYTILNVLVILGIVIALPAATPSEFVNDAEFAFGNFTNLTAWPPGFAFVLSFLAPLWTIGAFDCCVHISEEASNANVAVPWAIILANMIAAVLGWGVMIAIVFCMGTDVESIVSSPIGQPLAAIFFNSFGQRGTLAIWAIIVTLQFLMGTSLLTVASRQSFAFARDGALPFSRILYRINPYTLTPVNSVWFTTFAALALGLLAFAGSAAIGAVFTLCVTANYLAFSIPITARFAFHNDFKPGPFTLGRWGLPVAAVAVSWMCFCMVIFQFPTNPNPAVAEMNYTVVVLGGVMALCLTYYYFPRYGGVHWFKGPVSNIELDINGKQEETISRSSGESEDPQEKVQ
ncbi:APC amino acid permease [Neolentinus lepideus HHB14362 ss-1]|uniref:APC amino acid permease n=1 Tax=Neolentinus lepideus HHB14362 ss-1 TaxID=1314782 RepID=A0A165UNU7_9AGAM|nr:APC amino acid permease [Neolentinus lepideus HHB14362 ss-1]